MVPRKQLKIIKIYYHKTPFFTKNFQKTIFGETLSKV